MAMITRLTRLFRADLHAVLDRIEEPELLLRQSLREMDEALNDDGRALEQDRRNREALVRRQQEISAGLANLVGEVDLVLDADNEALARILLRRRLQGERLLAQLVRQSASLETQISERQRALEQQRAQFEQLRQQAQAQAQTPTAGADGLAGSGWGGEPCSVTDADVELALLRERRRRA